MNNKEVKNIKSSEDDFEKLISELKTLPSVELPSDFERELRDKIAQSNLKRQKKTFLYSSYSKTLVFGGSFIVIICLVLFSVTLFRGTKEPVVMEASVDSAYYGNKKVVVIPPTENTYAGSIQKPMDKITKKKDKAIDNDELKEYFGEEKGEKTRVSVQSSKSFAPAPSVKSMEMDRNINIDTLRKKDSLKKILDKKK